MGRPGGGDTEQNEVSIEAFSATREYTHPAFPSNLYILTSYGAAAVKSRLCSLGAIAASLVISTPKPSFVFAHDRRRRASLSAHSHTHPHMMIGTCQTAQPWFRCATS